jgi:hypothetical protein
VDVIGSVIVIERVNVNEPVIVIDARERERTRDRARERERPVDVVVLVNGNGDVAASRTSVIALPSSRDHDRRVDLDPSRKGELRDHAHPKPSP